MTEIDALIAKVNKRLKADVLGYANELLSFQRVTSGSLTLDLMLGGGWPLNCWNEIIGLESSGKTAITLKTIAANQANDPNYHTLWVASEEFNREWAESLGVDTGRIVLAKTNVMEDAYQIIIEALDSQNFDAVVVDSYPALIPTVEADAAMDEWSVGVGARLTNKLMRKSPPAQRRVPGERNCLAIIVNQWRDKIGGYGDPRTTPGGKGKNFSYFTRVEVGRDEWIADGDANKVGQTIKCRTLKNKTSPPQQVGQVDFYFKDHPPFAVGDYDNLQQVWAVARTYDIIEGRGAWFYYGDQKWNGKERAVEGMRSDPALAAEIEAQVRHRRLGEPLPPKPRTIRKKK